MCRLEKVACRQSIGNVVISPRSPHSSVGGGVDNCVTVAANLQSHFSPRNVALASLDTLGLQLGIAPPSDAPHVIARGQQLPNDGSPEKSTKAGNQDAHVDSSRLVVETGNKMRRSNCCSTSSLQAYPKRGLITVVMLKTSTSLEAKGRSDYINSPVSGRTSSLARGLTAIGSPLFCDRRLKQPPACAVRLPWVWQRAGCIDATICSRGTRFPVQTLLFYLDSLETGFGGLKRYKPTNPASYTL